MIHIIKEEIIIDKTIGVMKEEILSRDSKDMIGVIGVKVIIGVIDIITEEIVIVEVIGIIIEEIINNIDK